MDTQIPVRISRKAVEATDIVSLELAPLEGASLPPFSAGSHIDVEVKPGLVRQYSLCNDPTESHRYLIGVLRDPASRGGSTAVHDLLQEGQVVRISAPRNHFALVPAGRSLLFAGGIGVTPILCMAERLAQSGADFEMHYCARSADRAAFVERIRASRFADRVHFHYDDGDADQKLNLAEVLAGAAADTHLYVCGPGGFIDFVTQGAAKLGWPQERVHFEYFAGQKVDTIAGWQLRRQAGQQRQDRHRAAHQDRGGGPARGRRQHRGVVRAGRVRNLPDPGARRRDRPPRPVLHRRGKSRQ